MGFIVRVKGSKSAGRFDVTDDGRGIGNHAGLSLPAQVANHVGLTDRLREALSAVRPWREHDPGVVARDLAVMLVDGGDCVSDLAPRDAELFGEHAGQATASQPTAWRTIEAVAADELALTRVEDALAEVRGHVWGLSGGAPPVLDGEAGERVCVDLDAALVTAHSEKDGAAGTYKGTFGYHPHLAFVDRGDGTGEALAGVLGPGNAGSNTAADHIELLDAAPTCHLDPGAHARRRTRPHRAQTAALPAAVRRRPRGPRSARHATVRLADRRAHHGGVRARGCRARRPPAGRRPRLARQPRAAGCPHRHRPARGRHQRPGRA